MLVSVTGPPGRQALRMGVAVVVALVTAFLYTAGLAMQQRGNLDAMRHGTEGQSGAGKAVSVLKRPMWLMGNLVGFAGFGTQGLALRFGGSWSPSTLRWVGPRGR